MSTQSFPLVRPSPGALIALGGFVFTLMPILGFMGWSLSTQRTVTIDERGLSIEHSAYATTLPKSALRVAAARPIDLTQEPDFEPTVRKNGTGLPGLREGWFALKNGEKALVVVTDPRHVAYIPTTQGHAVLLSVADPAALIAALK